MQNFYSLLEISETASQAEIKAAFKRLALLYHPDKHSGDESMSERFKEINLAYQTLSNPYEKARYDLKLIYSRSTQPIYEEPIYRKPPAQRQYRRSYSERKIDWKENWIATAYAFGFTFIVATIVMTAVFIKNFYDDLKYKELLMQRRGLFVNAQENYKLGKVDDALMVLNKLSPYLKEEIDMVDYKQNIYNSFIDNGEHSYYNRKYDEAIYYFELIEKYSPKKPIALKEHLAKSYMLTHQPHESIKLFTELLLLGYRHLDCYLAIGEIYRDQLFDLEEAKRYFVLADELAVKQYKAIYGDAYPLILSGRYLPEHHYTLYTGLANIYLDLGLFEKAVKTTDWNVQVWPDSAENYAIAAKGHLALNHIALACKNFRIASVLGYSGTVEIDCQ